MNIYGVLSRIDILQTILETPRNISEITANCSASRSTIRKFLRNCTEEGLICRSSDSYALTAVSKLILREYGDLTNEKQNALSLLAENQNKHELLRTLDAQPTDKAELARCSELSRKTVGKHIDDFIANGWCEKCSGGIKQKLKGKRILESYDQFKEIFNAVDEKTEFLERYEGPTQCIPIRALAESRQVVSTMEYRQKVVHEVNDMHLGTQDPTRGLSHAFSAEISDNAYANISPETRCELIVDRSVYKTVTNPKNWKYLFKSLQYPELDILILPGDVTVGLGYSADKEAVIAAYNDDNPLHVGLFGENDAFVEWIQELYEYYRTQANTPPRDLFEWAISSAEMPLPG